MERKYTYTLQHTNVFRKGWKRQKAPVTNGYTDWYTNINKPCRLILRYDADWLHSKNLYPHMFTENKWKPDCRFATALKFAIWFLLSFTVRSSYASQVYSDQAADLQQLWNSMFTVISLQTDLIQEKEKFTSTKKSYHLISALPYLSPHIPEKKLIEKWN